MDLSIIIPVFNAAATIERAITSLKVIQERGRIEVIVVDDGSTDGSPALARQALARLDLGSSLVLQQPNAGTSAARNRALQRCTGRWVYFLDADDELLVDALSLVDAATAHATAVLASAIVQRDGRIVHRYKPFALQRARVRQICSTANPLPMWAALLRRDCIVREFDVALPYLEDWQFWIHNDAVFDHAVTVPKVVLTKAHAHGGNKSSQYQAIGRCREQIAQGWLDHRDKMGSIERNNWKLQREIGRILQGLRPRWRSALALPCNMTLYAKFLAHALAGRWVLAHDPYAPKRS